MANTDAHSLINADFNGYPYQATANGNLYILPAGKTIRMSMPDAYTTFTIENCYTGKDKKLTVTASDFDI